MEHTHKGVERSNGTLRSHPIERQHKDENVKLWHTKALTSRQGKYIQTTPKKPLLRKLLKNSVEVPDTKNTVLVPIDNDGYISINVEKINAKGVRISFVRVEGQIRKTVGLQIENEK